MFTLTFGTDAPVASLTVPRIVAVGNCASAGMANSNRVKAQVVLRNRIAFLAIFVLPGFARSQAIPDTEIQTARCPKK
jgi:hypothetical protein